MASLDYTEIKLELVMLLRNNDIMTTTERGVTTATDTGTFSAASSHTISRTNVKNIRSITVGGSALTYGTDYSVDLDYDSDPKTCVITFTANQTGAYSISYDYGTDKIFPEFARPDLSSTSFPRIGLEILGDNTEDADVTGQVKDATISFSVAVYGKSNDYIESKLKAIKDLFLAQALSLYTLQYVTRITTSALGDFGDPRYDIKTRSVDYFAPHNTES